MTPYPEIVGADALYDWFGYWPDFHDAKLLSLTVTDDAVDCTIHAFRMTTVVDERGYYVLDRDVIVALHMTGILDNNVTELTSPNTLLSLKVAKMDGGYELLFFDVYGIDARVQCANIEINFRPGAPAA